MNGILDSINQFWVAIQTGSGVPWGPTSYLLLAVLVFLEGPIATLLGAAASSTGLMNPWLVFASASAGNLSADIVWYSLGFAGRTDWLVRHGRWIKLRNTHIDHLKRDINLHARKILLAAKLTASFSVPALIAAGMARVPWRRWFTTVFGAEVIWTGGLVLIGYHFTLSISRMEAWLKVVAIAAFVLFVFMIGRYGLRFLEKWGELVEADERENGALVVPAPNPGNEHEE
jgi:membrane protein DedA with SNARE-associated domain